jgi:hypothetical protein
MRRVSDDMPAKPDTFTFAAIGDLHVREDRTSLFRELFAETASAIVARDGQYPHAPSHSQPVVTCSAREQRKVRSGFLTSAAKRGASIFKTMDQDADYWLCS